LFVLGDDFSIAGCGVVTMVALVGRIGVGLSPCGDVAAWTGRCCDVRRWLARWRADCAQVVR
jgi:glutathione S-transferase